MVFFQLGQTINYFPNISYKEVLRVLDLLAALKTTNGHLSDAEYRKKAEDIVRADYEPDPLDT